MDFVLHICPTVITNYLNISSKIDPTEGGGLMNKKCEGFDRIPVCMLLDAQPLVKFNFLIKHKFAINQYYSDCQCLSLLWEVRRRWKPRLIMSLP